MTGNPDNLQRDREMTCPISVKYVDAQGREDEITRSGLRLVRRSDSRIMGTGNEDAARRIAEKLGTPT